MDMDEISILAIMMGMPDINIHYGEMVSVNPKMHHFSVPVY